MKLKKADADISVAKYLLSPSGNPANDENITDIAAYHVQQGIEKALKYILCNYCKMDETNREFKVHKLASLIVMIEERCDFIVPTELKLSANDITSWEAKCRYDESPIAFRNDILEAINLYEALKMELEKYDKKIDTNNK